MIDAGLVLEGGGMKGAYTAGVLDFFMENELYFSNCYGVSAGAVHLCSYISKQPKRAYRVSLDYLDNKDYCSVKSLITTGDLFNAKFCYDDIPNRLDLYDYKTAAKYEGNAYAVVTNVRTGKPEYMPLREMHKDILVVRASASLPLVSRNVKIGNQYYLDGGFADGIPIKHSIAEGNKKNVVILTKEVGYVRKQASNLGLIKLCYMKYPKVYELMANRHISYNETTRFIEEEEKAGRIFVIRPQVPTNIGRLEKNREKIENIYKMGYEDAKKSYENLMKYLNS